MSITKRSSRQILDEVLWRFKKYDLTSQVSKQGAAVARGGYFDVYHGRLGHGPRRTLVAIRQLQHLFKDTDSMIKSIAQEIRIWSQLHHPNVLPFLGFTLNCGPYPASVSQWMENGTAEQYLKRDPSACYLSVIRGVAKGLQYLHSQNVIHSDLKGANILISDNGEALLADFNVSRHLQLSRSILTTKDHTGSLRWMAIESFECDVNNDEADDTQPRPATRATDIWAFGLTVLEIATGVVPYNYITTEAGILFAILHQKAPFKSRLARDGSNVDDQLWAICHLCVAVDPSSRPSMDSIVPEIDCIMTRINQSRSPRMSVLQKRRRLDADRAAVAAREEDCFESKRRRRARNVNLDKLDLLSGGRDYFKTLLDRLGVLEDNYDSD